MLIADLKKLIREVPDFPKAGITFYDVTTLFRQAEAFESVVSRLSERFRGEKIDAIASIEARGFVLGAAMARALDTGLVLVRKPGKLPWQTESIEYALEYGTGRLEMHRDAVAPGQRVLIVDDVLATGGTAAAASRLVTRLGGAVQGFAFLLELGFLGGRKQLGSAPVFALVQYDEGL